MPSYTFADLRTARTVAVVEAEIAAALTAAGAPVANWAPKEAGGVENIRLNAVANTMVALVEQRIALGVTGRVLPLAVLAAQAEIDSGVSGGPASLALRKLVTQFYKLAWRDPTFTVQNVRLSTIGNPGTYTFNPGDLWVQAPSTGNRYNNVAGGVLNPGQTLDLPFQAENPGAAYADAAGTITTLVTARAGVQCVNVRPADFTATRSSGGSSGTYAASFAVPGVLPSLTSLRVRVVGSGEIGTALVQLSTDGGRTWGGAFVVPASLVAGGALLTFSNGTPPSFIVGDVLTAFVGDCILQRGADQETPAAVGERCSNRYPAISLVPTVGKMALWAHQASQEVERVWSDADPNVPGGTLMTIASASGPASPQAQIAVEDYVTARLLGYKGVAAAPGFTTPQEAIAVSTATARNCRGAGVVYVPRDRVAPVQRAANSAWLAYLRSVPLGGMRGAVVRAAKLEDILTDAGAGGWLDVFVSDGVADYEDMDLNAGEVAVSAPGASLQTDMLWVPT